jgi:AhpD family alkylhydroperoxidase
MTGFDSASPSASFFSDEVKELVALGASVASNCERCFEYHCRKATQMGISREDMLKAATVGERIRSAPAKALSDLVATHLIASERVSPDLPVTGMLLVDPSSDDARKACSPNS